MGVSSGVDRHIGTNLVRQAVVVQVRMGEQHTQQAIVGVAEAGYVGQKALMIAVGCVQGQPQVENDAASSRFHLNAGAADFLRAAMDANSHPPRITWRDEPICLNFSAG